jgi:hypothetical protein
MPRIPYSLSVAVVLALGLGQARAQTVEPVAHRRAAVLGSPECCCPPALPSPLAPQAPQIPGQLPGQQPGQGEQPPTPPADTAPPSTDAFAQGPPAGGAETGGFNPAMFGDLIGGPNVQVAVRMPNGATVAASVPVIARGAFKIADNESPRPTDRVFFTYNYFDRVNTSTFGFTNPPFNLNRELIGFERTYFNGNASIGMRLPFLQLTGNFGNLSGSQVGDLSIILKWAFLNNRQTGNVWSAGMVVTAPTGQSFINLDGRNTNPTLLQPYTGYIYNRGRFFLQGFASIVAPTDSAVATIMFNDIGLGYWVYRNPTSPNFIKGVVPTFETHVLTPLNHRGSADFAHVPDWVSLTGGVNLVFGRASTLGFALGAPITGPRPYNVEAIGSINLRF